MNLLDTCTLSEMRKFRSGKADQRVVDWFRGRSLTNFYLSVITILEVKIGILRTARNDVAQAQVYQLWLDDVLLVEFRSRILPIDLAVANRCAALHAPDPQPERDALIAATALVHGMTVVTRNQHDFAPMGVALINPWN